MWNEIKTVWLTDLVNHLRDRRALLAVLGFSLMGPVGAFALVMLLNSTVNEERPVLLDVVGADNAPTLVAWLEEKNIEVTAREDDSLEAIPDLGQAEALLVIPDDFAERYAAAVPARLRLYRDDRENRSAVASRTVRRLLREYEVGLAQMRLNARGIPGHMVTPLIIDDANVAQADGSSLNFANTLLYFVIFAPFFAGLSIAIDTTAGEREKASLLPLMAQPVSPLSLVLGKYLTVASFGLVGMVLAVLAQFNLLRFAPLEELGISLAMDLGSQARIIIILLPMALAVSALQIFVALLAKSFKEAQTYLTVLSFLPVGLGMYGTFATGQASTAQKIIPVLSQIDLMRGVMSEGPVDLTYWALALVIMVIIGVSGLAAAVWRMSDERILSSS